MDDTKIEVKPTPITSGEKVTISYNGLLAESGAKQVYLHAGVGFNDSWQDVTSIQMKKEGDKGWQAQLKINTVDRFNFCFKDSAENWDNNQGSNWSFEVHDGQQYN